MNGKRLRAGETYVAQRTLANGRIIAYRKNKREIAALVKALKADGITDKELLDPKAWLATLCYLTKPKGCGSGTGCVTNYSCKYSPVDDSTKRQAGANALSNQVSIIGRCVCSP